LSTPAEALDIAAPKLSREEELYAISLTDLASQTLGSDAAVIVSGDTLVDPAAAARTLMYILSNGEIPAALESVPAVKQLSQSLAEIIKNSGFASSSSEENSSSDANIGDVVRSLSELSEKELEVLQQWVGSVGYKVLEKVLDRMQILNVGVVQTKSSVSSTSPESTVRAFQ